MPPPPLGRPRILLAAAALGLAGSACTRVVDVDVGDAPVQLVVEGRIEYGASEQLIRLTTTDRITSGVPLPKATGAVVEVSDDRGTTDRFTEAGPGEYRNSTLTPRIGGRYTLRVLWQDEQYQAVADLKAGPPIDSLYFRYFESSAAIGDSGIRALIDYTDPPGLGNYYFWELFVDGRKRTSTDPGNRWRIISGDDFYDGGRIVGYLPYNEDVVVPGDQVRMRQLAITEETYRYYFAFYEQSTGQGGPFSTPPASVRGNVANLTNPAHRALGFFLAAQVHEWVLVVPGN
jgi:hypothetical protein